jgi:hypothetical protein
VTCWEANNDYAPRDSRTRTPGIPWVSVYTGSGQGIQTCSNNVYRDLHDLREANTGIWNGLMLDSTGNLYQ